MREGKKSDILSFRGEIKKRDEKVRIQVEIINGDYTGWRQVTPMGVNNQDSIITI